MEQEFIEKKTEWIRSIRPGETKKGFVREYEELDTLSTLASRFNQSLGRDRGVVITSKRNWYEKSFTIVCNKIQTESRHGEDNAKGG